MHYLDKIVLQFIQHNNTNKNTLVLGFSGGVDSLILAYILSKHNIPFVAVHVEHGLSENALKWVKFCQNFAEQYNFKLFVEHVNVTKGSRESLENEARILRYQAYKKYYDIYQSAVLLGHHSDDLVESMLMNLLNRAGIKGLGTMPDNYFNEEYGIKILRPYLSKDSIYYDVINKQLLLDYAKEYNLDFIFDESNHDNSFSRNFLRNEIIPKLQEHFGNINKPMMKTNEQIQKMDLKEKEINPEFEGFYILENENDLFNNIYFLFKKHLNKRYSSNTINQIVIELKRAIQKNNNNYVKEFETYSLFVFKNKIYFMDNTYTNLPFNSFEELKNKNLNLKDIFAKNQLLKEIPYVFRKHNIYKLSDNKVISVLNFNLDENLKVKKERNNNFFNKVIHYFNL